MDASVLGLLLSSLEDIRVDRKTPAPAKAAAAKARLRLQTGRDAYAELLALLQRTAPVGSRSRATVVQRWLGPDGERATDMLSPLLLLLSHKDLPDSSALIAVTALYRLVQVGVVTPLETESVLSSLEGLRSRKDDTVDFKTLQIVSLLLTPPGNPAIDPDDLAVEYLVLDSWKKGVYICLAIMAGSNLDAASAPLSSSSSGGGGGKSQLAQHPHSGHGHVGGASAMPLGQAALSTLSQTTSSLAEASEKAPSHFFPILRAWIIELSQIPLRNDVASKTSDAMSADRLARHLSGAAEPSGGVSDMSSSSPSYWIPSAVVPSNSVALELLETSLAPATDLSQLGPLVAEHVSPILVRMLRGRLRDKSEAGNSWPKLVRLMRVSGLVLGPYRRFAKQDAGLILSELFNKILATTNEANTASVIVTPPWLRALVAETVLKLFRGPDFLLSTNLDEFDYVELASYAETLSRLARHCFRAEELEDLSRASQELKSRPMARGLELLGEPEPPAYFTNALVVVVATECLVSIADATNPTTRVGFLRKCAPNVASAQDASFPATSKEERVESKRELLRATWRPALNTLALLLAGCEEEAVVQYTLRALVSFATACGQLDLVEPRDEFIVCMCREALPRSPGAASNSALLRRTSFARSTSEGSEDGSIVLSAPPSPLHLGGAASGANTPNPRRSSGLSGSRALSTTSSALLPKHVQILKALFNIAYGLGSILGTSWHLLMETFEQLDVLLTATSPSFNARKRGIDSIESLLATSSSSTQTSSRDGEAERATTPMPPDADLNGYEDDGRWAESMLRSLFEFSQHLDEASVRHLCVALSHLVFTALADASTLKSDRAAVAAAANVTSAATLQASASSATMSPSLAKSFSGGPDAKRATASFASRVMNADRHKLLEGLTSSLKNLGEKISVATTDFASGSNNPSSPAAYRGAGESPAAMSALQQGARPSRFALEKLVEVALLNAHRLGVIWEVVGNTLITVASSDGDPSLRVFAVKGMERLVSSGLSASSSVAAASRDVRKEYVRKFTELTRSPHLETKEATLSAMYRLVSSAGQEFEGVWNLLVAELLIIVTSANPQKSLTQPAFKVVQLIMDDYRPSLDAGCLPSLAMCLRAFGENQEDVNVSLTAVHHLWLLCEKADEGVALDPETQLPTAESLTKANALWLHVFHQLRALSLDPRMEVRNSALRSLCTNIVATGDRLTLASWKVCAMEIMLPLNEDINARAHSANHSRLVLGERLSSHSDHRMAIHHTSDTEEKQWRETRLTVLQGTSKVVIGVMTRVPDYAQLEWFNVLWSKLLTVLQRDLILDSPAPPKDVCVAAVSVWEELALLACGVGARTKFAVPGMRVVNGTLMPNKREQTSSAGAPEQHPDPAVDETHAWLWPSLLAVLVKVPTAPFLADGASKPPSDASSFDSDVAALLVNAVSELYDANKKDSVIRRSPEAFRAVLDVTTRLVGVFHKPGRFVSTLERAVLQLYRKLPPPPALVVRPVEDLVVHDALEDGGDAWDMMLSRLSAFACGNNALFLDAPTSTFVSWTVAPSEDGDSFSSKAYVVYLETLATAPASARARTLRQAMSEPKSRIPPKVIRAGLASLPQSGMLEEQAEDLWMKALERSDARPVVLEDAVHLLTTGAVPPALELKLVDVVVGEVVSSTADFATTTTTLNNILSACAYRAPATSPKAAARPAEDPGARAARTLIPSLLKIAAVTLERGLDRAEIETVVASLVSTELQPELCAGVRWNEAAAQRAHECGHPKAHVLELLEPIAKLAADATHRGARVVAAHALRDVAREAWDIVVE